MNQKPNSIVPPILHGAPAQVLDPIGTGLASIIEKQNEARLLVDGLWQRYLMDCHRHGVEPNPKPSKENGLSDLEPYPCPHKGNHGIWFGRNLNGSKRNRCKECGREVCTAHFKFENKLCPDCSKPGVPVCEAVPTTGD